MENEQQALKKASSKRYYEEKALSDGGIQSQKHAQSPLMQNKQLEQDAMMPNLNSRSRSGAVDYSVEGRERSGQGPVQRGDYSGQGPVKTGDYSGQGQKCYADLLARAVAANATDKNDIKIEFLKYFSKEYSPHLKGEIEYFQFLSQEIAYLDLQVGDEVSANIDTSKGDKIPPKVAGGVTDPQEVISNQSDSASDYAKGYKVEKTYHNKGGLNATLILPNDGDTQKNAIVLFRGTGGNTMGRARGEQDGVLADTDYGGVGRVAFALGSKEMDAWINMVKPYNRITIAGHSLGGAMAERFYIKASKTMASKLRIITYQGAAIDRYTTGKVMGKNDPQKKGAKSTRVVARGDVVPLGGMAHIGSEKLKYSESDGTKYNPLKAHIQTDLAKNQIDQALGNSVKQVTNVVVHEKEGGTNMTKFAFTAGKHVASIIGHAVTASSMKGLYGMIKAGTSTENIK